MPELPEVEVLVRHLRPVLLGRVIESVTVVRPKIGRPETSESLTAVLSGRHFTSIRRRAKYLLFDLDRDGVGEPRETITAVGHLGMTGRMFVQPREQPLPKHTGLTMDLGGDRFVFEDTRVFGRFNLDVTRLEGLGPEPLSEEFTLDAFSTALGRSRQPIKVKLLDQRVVAGIGNIYASESLFHAGIHPGRPASRVRAQELERLRDAIREVLSEAIRFGSTVPLAMDREKGGDQLFYFGQAAGASGYEERLEVYDRKGKPCRNCGAPIRHAVQAGRSTYWCPRCQRR